ncbi:hypothetical protein [Burkholderia vietnamiensis]|uniref:hypothetical protein n=1 Tax=Burkholderia vietnamiensis TaxID=60552 RepID=UPI001593A8C2|nr:hypothetical protein [Burkholderia vietnamiensis]
MSNVNTNTRLDGVNLPGVAAMVIGATVAVAAGLATLLLTWRGLLPGFFALGVFPLALGAVSLLTSDLRRTDEENLDRWIGVALHGEARATARAVYAELMLLEELGGDTSDRV